ncbi:protein ALP1-like [Trichonephila clavipes]|nr:protein ALP1-like [Trichonephila clavipes]
MSEELVLSGVLVLSKVIKKELIRRQNAKRKKRKVWVKPWVGRRTEYGASHTLLKELKNEDHTAYRNMLRITGEQFDELLEMVRGKLSKQDTTMKMAIPVTTKLEITLRYLATGDSFKSLEYLFRVPETTISRFLPHVLTEICCVLRPFINVPTTVEEWKKIEKVFLHRWNFPRCCGAIDGKHVLIKRPPGSGSVYYNYKKTYSIILFPMVDADYCFTYVDVGGNGRANDSAVFRNSSLNIAMENKAIGFPEDHVIIGDDAFPLRPDLMKPFSKHGLSDEEKIFNYRTSRARRVSENAFGILAWRFRVFSKAIELKPDTIDRVILAACSLHNWLRKTSPGHYMPQNALDREDFNTGEVTPGQWRLHANTLRPVTSLGSNNPNRTAIQIRQQFMKYFTEENPLPWQWEKLGLKRP